MERRAAKELLHIRGWLMRADEIVARGKDAYLADDLLQEAGDSLMMKLGEAAGRLSKLDVLAPEESTGRSPSRTATSSSIGTTRSTASKPGSRCPRTSPPGAARSGRCSHRRRCP